MRSERVVLLSPLFYERLGFLEGIEDLPVEYFVSELAVETLTVSVFPGVAGLDV